MNKQTIEDINVAGKRVLVRLDLNVPLNDQQQITDDRRIQAALPTIRKLLDGRAALVLVSHLGRPGDNPTDRRRFSLEPVATRLGELLGQSVKFVEDCVGPQVQNVVKGLQPKDVVLLENLRFHEAETIKDKSAAQDHRLREHKDTFARALADLTDVYVNDAFGTCHRDNASMLTVPQMMEGKPRVAGYLVQRELDFLCGAIANPQRPFVCLLGGAKVSDKLGTIEALLKKCDIILIGGAMAYTFLAAQGMDVGQSLVEPDLLATARGILSKAGDRLKLPVDSIIAAEIAEHVETGVTARAIPSNRMGLDIGPKTVELYRCEVSGAKTVLWNGPMGVFEVPPFDRGTVALAAAIAQATDRGAVSIVGGGDSAAAVERAQVADRITHVSTGGGASLELLEGRRFAAIDILDDRG